MWGKIVTETTFETNFNTQFPNTKTDLLIHLAQWQYWWWFWFSFLWVLYYLFLAKTLRYRTLKFRPKIVSSFRPHGKWGDLIICLLPISWCANILINSNFLLKLLEWQAESSLFTIRIRGKQWYWVYKFDFRNFSDIISTPKNVGNNKWMFSFFGDLKTSDNYLHIIQMRAQNKSIKKYWVKNLSKFEQEDKLNVNLIQDFFKIDKFNNSKLQSKTFNQPIIWEDIINIVNASNYLTDEISFKKSTCKKPHINFIKIDFDKSKFNTLNYFLKDTFSIKNDLIYLTSKSNLKYNYNTFSSLEETNRVNKSFFGKQLPITLVKLSLTDVNNTSPFLKFRYSDENSVITQRNMVKVPYFVFKQVRYKRRKLSFITNHTFIDNNSEKVLKSNFSLNNQYSVEPTLENPVKTYRMFRKNRIRNEHVPVIIAKRLLRVKRTLVLPTHINITAITNSYDVVHSWFIPGLGLKMDCVPGRSTHHTFYVDNAGFYYGQCAEICGRFHHHMPIRVCALPFEHFLIWWHSIGLPKLLYPSKKHKVLTSYTNRKFVW
jgi:heme/copper-type cytochrome/quinol oxidase subunit 2